MHDIRARADGPDCLPERIAALPNTRWLNNWTRLLAEGLNHPAVRAERAALLERTRATVGAKTA